MKVDLKAFGFVILLFFVATVMTGCGRIWYSVNPFPSTLAVASQSAGNVISILYGNGDGTFQQAIKYASGTNPLYLVVGDFNLDGLIDMAILSNGDNAFNVMLQHLVH